MESKARKVLIADDEPDILEILKFNLENEGYEVFTAKDGDEAVGKSQAKQTRSGDTRCDDAKKERGGSLPDIKRTGSFQ